MRPTERKKREVIKNFTILTPAIMFKDDYLALQASKQELREKELHDQMLKEMEARKAQMLADGITEPEEGL